MKKRLMVSLIVVEMVMTFLLLGVSAERNQDWPMFRHDPQHTGYIDCKMSNDLELLWRQPIGSLSAPSPAVVHGRVYVNDRYSLRCLDYKKGTLLWIYQPGHLSLGHMSSPAVLDGKVYIGSRSIKDEYNNLYCLDTNKGELIWKYESGGSSPTVLSGKVYSGSRDNFIYCLDAESGDLIWKYETGDPIESSPAVADGKVYIGSDDNSIYCLDTKDGELIWSYQTYDFVTSDPTISKGYLYVGSLDGGLYCFGKKESTTSPSPSTTSPHKDLVSKYHELYKSDTIFRSYGEILLILFSLSLLYYCVKKSGPKKIEKKFKLYILYIIMPIYIVFFYIFIGIAENPNYWVIRTDKIFGIMFLLHIIVDLFVLLMFANYVSEKKILSKLEEGSSMDLLMSCCGLWFGLLFNSIITSFCAGIYYSKLTYWAGYNDVVSVLLLNVFSSILLTSYIFHDYKIWSEFPVELKKSARTYLFPYIFIILSITFFVKWFQQIPGDFFSLKFMLLAFIFVSLSPLAILFKKSNLLLRKIDILIILLVPTILVSNLTLFYMKGSRYWVEKPEFILIWVLSMITLMIMFIILGVVIYFLFSHPRITLLFLYISYKIARFWNYIQLDEATGKSQLHLDPRKNHGLTDLQLLLHFFLNYYSSICYYQLHF